MMNIQQVEEDTPTPQGQTTATAMVSIQILDVNDQMPTFTQSSYEAVIQENTVERIPVSLLPLGTEIIVRDFDEVINHQLRTIGQLLIFVLSKRVTRGGLKSI